ncbi:hypothetical protein [Motiliproteus sp. MSK22-1]|uniref:hypothetical protein n=1 Tax=Motiliproteus sp. MSK22-1 TaxID=1897630 RepID=UPI00117D8A90|nr:hypothetical protein [Motiliproteus sp. MSK22-1]
MPRPIDVTVQALPCAMLNTQADKALRRALCIEGLTSGIIFFTISVAFMALVVVCFWRNS